MKITQIKIGLHQFNESKWKKVLDVFRDRYIPIAFIKDENNYFAEAIEFDDKCYYRVDGTTVEISRYEYANVIGNPRLYYFSSALKLHHRILKAKELGLGVAWPIGAAAPENIFDLKKNGE